MHHPITHTDTHGDPHMDPLADTLADLDSFIFRLRDVAHSLDVAYGDASQADRIARLADDLRAVHLRHKRPRVGLVRRLLDW